MPTLVHKSGDLRASIQFDCNECGKWYITPIHNISRSYTCKKCGARVNTLPIRCNNKGCGGRYRGCGGTIKKLSDKELRAAEEAAFASANLRGARPTDSFHDDMGDIRSSTIAYKCDRCGATFTAIHGIRAGFDSGRAICEDIVCDVCKTFPSLKDLPEPDQNVQSMDSDQAISRGLSWKDLPY